MRKIRFENNIFVRIFLQDQLFKEGKKKKVDLNEMMNRPKPNLEESEEIIKKQPTKVLFFLYI